MAIDPKGTIMGHPYKIAVLCELRDEQGRYLLIERAQSPNKGLFSPIGGKLETALGESPAQCAVREIHEEAGVELGVDQVELGGIIAECGYGAGSEGSDGTDGGAAGGGAGGGSGGGTNWLMFWFRVKDPVRVAEQDTREGRLAWHERGAIPALALPQTDREIIWPLVLANPSTYFAIHIICDDGPIRWTQEAGLAPENAALDR